MDVQCVMQVVTSRASDVEHWLPFQSVCFQSHLKLNSDGSYRHGSQEMVTAGHTAETNPLSQYGYYWLPEDRVQLIFYYLIGEVYVYIFLRVRLIEPL